MSRTRMLAGLMVFVVIILTGFQLYWLRDNYRRERISIGIRTSNIFEETITRLQDSMLRKRVGFAFQDSAKASNIENRHSPTRGLEDSIDLEYRDYRIPSPGQAGITIRDSDNRYLTKVDSIQPEDVKQVLVVKATRAKEEQDMDLVDEGLTHNRVRILSQTINMRRPPLRGLNSGTIIFKNSKGKNILIRLDSLLTDSIPLDLLTNEFGRNLRQRKIDIGFSVSRADTSKKSKKLNLAPDNFTPQSSYVYHLNAQLMYIAKKISTPIMFSIFLIGITIGSFLLVYRSLRQQQRIAQTRSDLVNNITHELKTPIATVSVAIEALKNFNAIDNREKTEEYLNISQQELQRLGLLVDKVLKLSMFESKDMMLNKQGVDLGQLTKEVGESLRLQLEKSNTDFNITSSGSLQIEGDRQHLQSVLFNLIDNSIKYNEGKLTAIKIHIIGTEDAIQLSVSDNGIGIPKGYHKKIFEKFFRVPMGDIHNAKGHGLGLSYVASVVKQHGGTITVDSAEDQGSVFTIRLPKTGA